MSNNKSAPKSLQRYVVVLINKLPMSTREELHYFRTQKEARKWAKARIEWRVKRLYRISYDYYGDV